MALIARTEDLGLRAGAPWAARARLRYVTGEEPGIRRVAAGKGFRYLDARGRPVRDPTTLARIRALVIPPAWTQVWICPGPRGHIQAVGRDARGRKQYRYHPRWRQVRDCNKFGRLIEFARALPRIRRAVARDLARPGLPREKVLATIVRLLERTSIRVGCDEYARDNRHFGLTTLLDRHVSFQRGGVRFHFRGKSGKDQVVDLQDGHLAGIVRRCQELPGQRLFQYLDGQRRRRSVGSGDVNRYLRQVSGQDFTAKDFRTWAATVCVVDALLQAEAPTSQAGKNRQVVAAIDQAAERLGNTRSVCRSAYVHPRAIDAFVEGWIHDPLRAPDRRVTPRGLDEAETATWLILSRGAKANLLRRSPVAGGVEPSEGSTHNVNRRAALSAA